VATGWRIFAPKRERRRTDGSRHSAWCVRWYEGARERSRSFDRLKDARAFEAKVRTLKRSEGLAELDAGRETVAEFAEEWWRVYAKPNLERSTLKNYAQLWNKHGLPQLGDLRLRDVTPRIVADFRVELERDGVEPAAVRKTLAVLQAMLQRAVEWERNRSNPVRSVRKPSARRKLAVRASPPEEIERLRARLKPRDAALISVLAYAGLRPQEALALQWRHVRDRTLLIEQAATDGQLKGQKTNRPPRSVELLAPFREDLAVWRAASEATRRLSSLAPTAGSGERTTGATGASESSRRPPRRSGLRHRGRTTSATRSTRCSSTKAGSRSSSSPNSSATTRPCACRPT
jgi:integrase